MLRRFLSGKWQIRCWLSRAVSLVNFLSLVFDIGRIRMNVADTEMNDEVDRKADGHDHNNCFDDAQLPFQGSKYCYAYRYKYKSPWLESMISSLEAISLPIAKVMVIKA